MAGGTPIYDGGILKPQTTQPKKPSSNVQKAAAARAAAMTLEVDTLMDEIYEILQERIENAMERTGKTAYFFWTRLGQHGRETIGSRGASGWNGFLRQSTAEFNLGMLIWAYMRP